MSGREWWTQGERDGQAVTDATICETPRVILALDLDRGKQIRDRRACPDHLAQADTALEAGREITRPAGAGVVADDPDSSNAVMQTLERCALQLLEAFRDEPAQACQHSIEPMTESNVEAVNNQMPAAKAVGVRDQFVERETNGGIVRSNDSPSARTDDDVDGNPVGDQLSEYAKMTGSAQSPAAQHEANANG